MADKQLKAVQPRPGQPLYICARDAIREAIDAGLYAPGQQMPSTKEMSEQLEVSLVTAHRALQELVNTGVLQRSQGKGTFVHQHYFDRKDTLAGTRVGLVFHAESSLADYYHSQLLQGVRQAAQSAGADLVLLRFAEDMRNECSGYLYFDPLPDDIDAIGGGLTGRRKQPILAIGAKAPDSERISSIEIDNIELAKEAIEHLHSLGHSAIGYVGGADHFSSSADRWEGVSLACARRGIQLPAEHVIKSAGFRLDEEDRAALARLLAGPNRPTAIFASGFFLALDAYAAAASAGLRIPQDVSIVGVDDPPSAEFLALPLTTLRQPLIQLGSEAFTTLAAQIQQKAGPRAPVVRTLPAELMVRRSTASAPALAGVATVR